ncbi:hypothetical protein P0F24_002856 [Vibrio metschnikovii]|nr:hypothetical protein [Vibrio metschnikovii]
MSQSQLVITLKDHGNGRVEVACRSVSGESQHMNDMAMHLAESLPNPIKKAIVNFYKTKGSKNAIH